MDNVLNSVKSKLNISEEDTSFDSDVLDMINATLSVLHQLGSSLSLLEVTDETVWDDFGLEDKDELHLIQTYMYLKTKLIFDPPTNSSLLENVKGIVQEYEYRINMYADILKTED